MQLDIMELINNFILNNSDNVVWFIFLFVFGFFLIYSLILVYHWLKYGRSSFTIWFAMILYFAVSFVCITSMYLSAIIIS